LKNNQKVNVLCKGECLDELTHVSPKKKGNKKGKSPQVRTSSPPRLSIEEQREIEDDHVYLARLMLGMEYISNAFEMEYQLFCYVNTNEGTGLRRAY